jgi:hypothetical protein
MYKRDNNANVIASGPAECSRGSLLVLGLVGVRPNGDPILEDGEDALTIIKALLDDAGNESLILDYIKLLVRFTGANDDGNDGSSIKALSKLLRSLHFHEQQGSSAEMLSAGLSRKSEPCPAFWRC